MIESPLQPPPKGEAVFVDDGEGGGGNDVLNTQFFTKGFDEGGLSGAHLAVEGDDEALLLEGVGIDELAGSLADGFYVFES